MKTQRGFGDLIMLAVYGAMAAAAVFAAYKAWNGFKEDIARPYVQAQIEADQKLIDTAISARDAALDEAKGARADRDAAQAASKAQSDALRVAEEQSALAQKAAREAGIKYAAEVAKKSGRISELASIAGKAQDASRSCQEVLGSTDRILRESQRQVTQ